MANHLIHPDFVGAYVYAITVNGVVRYIGKGRRHRAIEHFAKARKLNRLRASGEKVRALPFHNKLAKAMRNGAKVRYRILWKALTDEAAYLMEIAEIANQPEGQLWNLHSGGAGGDAAMMRRLWAEPDRRRQWVEAIAAGHRDQNYRERARAKAKAYWDDPKYYARQMAREKALWANPEYRSNRIAILKQVWADPERSAKKSALVKSQWTPERRAAMSENRRRAWADPEFKARASASIRASKAKKNDGSRQGGSLCAAESQGVQT